MFPLAANKTAKSLLTWALLSVCVTGHSYADGWRLYASYPTPGPNPRGYWADGSNVGYIVLDGNTPYVYRYSWERSTIVSSFPAPGGVGAWGITWASSTSFFITNNRTSCIYETTRTGSVLGSFRCPFDGPADLDIKFFNPPGLLVAIPDRNILALLDRTTGSLIGTYAGPGTRPTGYYGYAHMYVADAGTHTIYEDYVPIITGIQAPVGFCGLAFMAPPYDRHLYIIDDYTDRYYFYVRSDTVVCPASLGRVKALFE